MVDKFKASDEFRFDDDLDFNFGDMGADFGSIKDDRTPTTKLKDASKQVAKDYVKDTANITRFMRTAMPEAYGEAFDMIREGNTEIQNLYNSVKESTRPMIESTKGLVRTALPAARGILPQKLAKKIEEAVKPQEEQGYNTYSSQDSDDARIEGLLADIFKSNQEMDKQREERDNYRNQLAEGVDQVRHNDILSLIDNIRRGVSAQVSYQDKVTYNYQKKSLELQYRQFWATAEILKNDKETSKSLLEMMAAVQKNTALPDYAKLQNKEAFFEHSRNKFITDVRDSLFGGTTNYIRQVGENVRKQASGMLENFRTGFDAVEGIGGQMANQIANADQFGSSTEEEVVNAAAPFLLDELAVRGGNWTRKQLTKMKGVDRVGQQVSRVASELPERIDDLLTNPKNHWGPLESARQIAASLMPNSKADTQMEFAAMKDLNRPTQVTGQDTKSLREIIPGLLSRIHREIRIFRTGDNNTPLLTYDFERNRFSNDKEVGKSIRNRFGNAEETQRGINNIIDHVDRNGTLNEAQRKELSQELIGRVYDHRSLTMEKLANASNWKGENAEAFADVFKRYGKIGADGKMGMNRRTNKRQSSFIHSLRSTVSANGDPRAFVQEMINMGQHDVLLRSGMLDASGRINIENVKKYLAGYDVDGLGDLDEMNSTGVTTNANINVQQAPNKPVMSTPQQPALDLTSLEKMLKGSFADLGKAISEKSAPGANEVAFSGFEAPMNQANETLLRIEDILMNLDSLTSMHYTFVSGDETGGKSYTSLLHHLGDKAAGAAGAVAGAVRDAAGTVAGAASSAYRRARPMARRVGRKLFARARRLKNKVVDFWENDILVGLEEKPRLIAAVLKNGGYFDAATGKVIKSFKDIKGDVKDAAGRIVLRAEEIGDAYEVGELGRKLSEIIGSAWSKIKNGVGFLTNFIPNSARSLMNRGRAAVKYAKNLLPPYDVYVKGNMEKPLLYATMFKLGKYRSKKTNKVLTHPRDIDGEVLDENDNIVVNEDHLKEGLVDVRGGKVSSVASRIWARVGGKVINAFKMVKDIGADAFKWIGGKIKDSAAFIKNMISGRIDIGIYSKRTSDILEEIRDFMTDRWGRKKKVIGDSDGDGVRDNSLADMASKKKDKKDESSKEKSEAEKKGGFFEKLAGAFAGIKGLFSKKKKEDDDDDDDGFGLDDAADLADIADAAGDANDRRKNRKARRAKKLKKPGRLGRWGKGIKNFGSRLFGLGRGVAGTGVDVAKSGVVRKGLFNTTMPRLLARLGIGTAGAGLTAAGGALGAGSMLGTGLSVLGSAVSVLTSWPVMVGAGVGYLGYKAYKNSKKTKITPLSTVRLAQYGFTVDDKQAYPRIFELEARLTEHVTYDGEGWASVDRNKLDPKELAELFELNSSAKAARFLKWYDDRFYPVFTRALSAMKHLKVSEPNLSKVEEQIEPNAKEKYMDGLVESCSSYHDNMNGPPPDLKLKIDHKQVVMIANEQRVFVRKAEKNDTGKTVATDAVAAASPLMKQSIGDTAKKLAENADNYEVKDKAGNVLKNLSEDELKKALQSGATYAIRTEVPQQVMLSDPNRLDALTSIRFKTYGLRNMMLDKVQSLMAMEAMCAKFLMPNAKGVDFKATTDEILTKAGTFFGKHNTTGKQAVEWKQWFNERFLPVYLPFAAAVFKLSGKTDLMVAMRALTPAQQLKIANMITGQANIDGNNVASSVWEATSTPWADYELNTDPDSVVSNLETIRVLVSKIELKEPIMGKSENGGKARSEEDLSKPAFLYNTPRSKQAGLNGNANSRAAQGVQATGDFVLNTAGKGDVLSRVGEAAHISGGNGKKWADLPNPTGTGWAAMKDLIIAAANAVGIDPQALAAYISVESGFDPNARPRGGGAALGLGQFMPGTWTDMMKNYSAKLGVPAGTARTDARASALFTAMYLKQNLGTLKTSLKRDPSVAEGYLAHFLGPTGSSELLGAPQNAIAADVKPAAAKSNPNVFYDPQTKRPFTVKEVIENLSKKLATRPAEFGVKVADFANSGSSTAVASVSAPAAGAAPAPVANNAGAGGIQLTSATVPAAGNRNTQAGFGNTQVAQAVNQRPQQETGLKQAVSIDTSVRAETKSTGMPIKPGQALELVLQREPSTDDGTFGVLRLPDGSSFLTLELPWRDNRTAMSCIPPGTYKCAKRQTTRHGFAYEVKAVPGRSGILIHAGTTAGDPKLGKKADSQGCILLGLGRNTRSTGQKGITESQAAMKSFYEKMQDLPFTLRVVNGKGDEASVGSTKATEDAVRAASSTAPQSTAALATPISTGPTTPSGGLRGALDTVRGNGPGTISTGPTVPTAAPAGDPSLNQMAQMSRGFKPTTKEMQSRDISLVEAMTQNSDKTVEAINKNLEANLRTASSVERLVKILEEKGLAKGSSDQPATPAPQPQKPVPKMTSLTGSDGNNAGVSMRRNV